MTKKQDNTKEIDEIINNKRQTLNKSHEYSNQLIDSVKKNFSNLNISSIKIGNKSLNLVDKNKSFSSCVKDENYFTNLMNNGAPLFVLNVNTDNSGYYDMEFVMFNDRQINELIDEDLVMSLAPTCTIYSPKDKKPWSEIFSTASYQIFITDKNELNQLWANLKKWTKIKWHDDVMSSKKYFHKAENVFSINLIYNIPPDISWKFAQSKSKEIKLEEDSQSGMWDSLSQQEFKKIINSLVQIENNPKISTQISQILEQIKPMLADSISGKKLLQKSEKEAEKARNNLYKSFNIIRMRWKDWKQKISL